MMDYMREGGYSMWLMLLTAVAFGAFALTRPKASRASVLVAGCIALIVEGILGLATNLEAVSAHYTRFPDKVEAIGIGIGEAANAGTFSAMLAFLLGIGALIAGRRTST